MRTYSRITPQGKPMKHLIGENNEPLNLLTKEEFRDVAKKLDKNYSDEKFNNDWDNFIKTKHYKELS